MKKCIKCGIEKPLDGFYRGCEKCKKCVCFEVNQRRLWLKNNDPAWVEKEAERQRQKEKRSYYRKKLEGKIKRQPSKIFRSKYPEKYDAHIACSRSYIPDGHQNHHWSYKKENHLDVLILKTDDHYYIHRYIRYFQGQMCYKIKATGELLDTREKHEDFINAVLNSKKARASPHP